MEIIYRITNHTYETSLFISYDPDEDCYWYGVEQHSGEVRTLYCPRSQRLETRKDAFDALEEHYERFLDTMEKYNGDN